MRYLCPKTDLVRIMKKRLLPAAAALAVAISAASTAAASPIVVTAPTAFTVPTASAVPTAVVAPIAAASAAAVAPTAATAPPRRAGHRMSDREFAVLCERIERKPFKSERLELVEVGSLDSRFSCEQVLLALPKVWLNFDTFFAYAWNCPRKDPYDC